MFRSSQELIHALESEGQLIRVKEFVDPDLEISEIVDRICKSPTPEGATAGGYALLFENTGTQFPLLINVMGSERRMCRLLAVNDLDDVGGQIESLFQSLTSPKKNLSDKLKLLPELGKISSWMPRERRGKGKCQEVIMDTPDLGKLPVMKCWPHDGGKFLTLPVIHTVSPSTGIRNVGLYRMQVFASDLAGMHWHKHKVSAGHFNEYKKLGKKMPVAVALGGDPLNVFSAACPLPPNMDEYMFTGFLRKKKVELVKCLTLTKEEYGIDMYVPADADFVIEGYVDPAEELILEGPFGDHTGYYSLADYYPRFHVTCITHKKNAVYPSTIVGIPPQEDAWIGKAIERIFLTPIKMTLLPEIEDMHMPMEGVFHNLVIVRIKNEYEGHAQKVMSAMWGAGQMMFNKILVIVDGEIDIQDYNAVAKRITQHVDPKQDVYYSQGPMDVLDHACSKFAFGGKMCLDATCKEEGTRRKAEGTGKKGDSKPKEEITATTINRLKDQFDEIHDANFNLLDREIAVAFVSVTKNRKGHIKELHEQLSSFLASSGAALPKFIIYLEPVCELSDLKECMWRFANNFDPKRDSFLSEKNSTLGFDGSRKTKEFDDFERPWPNIICADELTIKNIDDKWTKMLPDLPLIPSPSKKYLGKLYPGEAVAKN